MYFYCMVLEISTIQEAEVTFLIFMLFKWITKIF